MYTMMHVVMVTSFGAFLTMQSCNRAPLADIPETPNVSFEHNIKPITSTVCIRCHSQGSRDYSQYKNAYGIRYSIYQRVVVDRSMPMGMFLGDHDRAIFRDWVNQGGNK